MLRSSVVRFQRFPVRRARAHRMPLVMAHVLDKRYSCRRTELEASVARELVPTEKVDAFYIPHAMMEKSADRPMAMDYLAQIVKEQESQIPRSLGDPNFASERFQDPENADLKYAHGTTTLGFRFKGGVLIAVDSRASMGSYIGSNSVKKVIEINDFLLGTMAGGAADCSFWERRLTLMCRMHELRNGSRISVAAASKILSNIFYSYRGRGLSCGTMVAGWDTTGPHLYYIDDDGTRLMGDLFSVGSGSTFAFGVLDNCYRYDMTEKEAVELGKRAIYHATHRDAYSGGCINVYVIREDGWEKMFSEDMNFLHYGQYAKEAAQRAQ